MSMDVSTEAVFCMDRLDTTWMIMNIFAFVWIMK